MSKLKKYGKLVLFDALAVLCFVGVILFGWIPGPGGIPLFILGLSLLAANHEWAQRWLETAKIKGVSFKKWLFPDKTWVKNLYDGGSITLMIIGGWVIATAEKRFVIGFGVFIVCFSLFVFLINRDRFDKISKAIKKLKH